jgi:hypothetical protein
MAAGAAGRSKSALAAYYQRLPARNDKGRAIPAAAHELARVIITLMTKGRAYVDRGQGYYELQYRQRVVRNQDKESADRLGGRVAGGG